MAPAEADAIPGEEEKKMKTVSVIRIAQTFSCLPTWASESTSMLSL